MEEDPPDAVPEAAGPHHRPRREDAEALLLVTRGGVVLDANAAAVSLLGRSYGELCGSRLEAVAPALAASAGDLPPGDLAPGDVRRVAGSLSGADGSDVPYEGVLRAPTPGIVQISLTSRIARSEAEAALRKRVEALETVRRISTLLHEAFREDEVVARAVASLAVFSAPAHVVVHLVRDGMLRLAGAGPDAPPEAALAGAAELARAAVEEARAEVEGATGRMPGVVDVARAELTAPTRAALADACCAAAVVLPVRHKEAVLGVITLLYPERPRLLGVTLEALQTVVRTVGLALANAQHHARLEREVAERQRAEEALRESRARYKAITEAIPDLIFRLTRDGHYTFVAAQDEGLLAQPPERLVGSTLEESIGGEAAALWLTAIRDALEAGGLQRLEYELVTLDGALHVFEGRVVPIPEADEVQVIVRDITERVRYEETLVEAKEQAEEMGRLKASFLANMSHEIRTPLTAILGLADVIAGELDGEPRELLELVRVSAQRLTGTLNSVLDLAQFESGTIRLRPARTELGALVRETTATFSRDADLRGLSLRCVTPEEPVVATIDPSAVTRILVNLVSNAVKFTEVGGVTVTLAAEDGDAVLIVEDTGIGIAPVFLPHIFEEFRQESEGISRAHQGAGLGLTITRHLVESLGGAIGLHSVRGQGTTFRVRFPLGAHD